MSVCTLYIYMYILWRFPKIGVALAIIHFYRILPNENHPACLGYPHDYGNPHIFYACICIIIYVCIHK